MTTDCPTTAYSMSLDRLAEEGRLRKIPPHRVDRNLLDLCSNDYMGLALRSKEWLPEFHARFPEVAMSASASRLLAADQKIFQELESYLECGYGRPALLFNSGYHANTGIISSLNIDGTLWVTDKLIHASAIDGLRLAGADFKRWNHNDVSHLRKILSLNCDKYERMIVVCESVYSMDGDIAPLKEIAALKKDFPGMMLYVDEAHAVGVFGDRGLGLCESYGILESVDILVGTLGKACASSGAFAICSDLLRRYLVNNARSLIFSTSLPPVTAAWTLFMLEKLSTMDTERARLAETSEKFRKVVENITGIDNPSRSAIIPFMTGNASKAVELSAELESKGILALPIRRPTVPPGGERIRFSLNASLTDKDIDRIAVILEEAARKCRIIT